MKQIEFSEWTKEMEWNNAWQEKWIIRKYTELNAIYAPRDSNVKARAHFRLGSMSDLILGTCTYCLQTCMFCFRGRGMYLKVVVNNASFVLSSDLSTMPSIRVKIQPWRCSIFQYTRSLVFQYLIMKSLWAWPWLSNTRKRVLNVSRDSGIRYSSTYLVHKSTRESRTSWWFIKHYLHVRLYSR